MHADTHTRTHIYMKLNSQCVGIFPVHPQHKNTTTVGRRDKSLTISFRSCGHMFSLSTALVFLHRVNCDYVYSALTLQPRETKQTTHFEMCVSIYLVCIGCFNITYEFCTKYILSRHAIT